MKQLKLIAALVGILAAFSGSAHAQAQTKASKSAEQSQKMDEAFARLKDSLSKGGSESVAGAGESIFSGMEGFGSSTNEGAPAVSAAPMSKAPRQAGLVKVACWEVCVKFGPLNVCYAWETKCK